MLFGSKRGLKTARNNFEFIAQNIAAIYCCLRDTPFGATLNEPQLLYATGLCDTIAYLQTGQLSYKDISDAVYSALCGKVTIGSYYRNVGDFVKFQEFADTSLYDNDNLINFAMQITALICFVEMRIPPRITVDSIASNESIISLAINKSMKYISSLPIYANVRSNVSIWASSPEFQSLVLEFDI